jgi:hypothetical protein
MADAIHYWRQALHCARIATEATDEEERKLLFEMSVAWKNLAVVEADVMKQVAAEWTLHTLIGLATERVGVTPPQPPPSWNS